VRSRICRTMIFGSAVFVATTLGARRVEGQASAESISNGKSAFTSAGCAACHGAQAQGTAGAPAIAPPPLQLPAMIKYVRQPTGEMPPISESTASDKQLADIFAYLQSLAPKASATDELKGNADSGKKLFFAYGCYECHGREGAGAMTGPRMVLRQFRLRLFCVTSARRPGKCRHTPPKSSPIRISRTSTPT
jgi:mono/diheme cytochrome c family protein